MCIFSESIDISETLSSCLSRSLIFWKSFRMFSRFPGACWTEQHPEFVLLFFPKCTLVSLSYSAGFQGYSKKFVPQIRRVARRDNVLLLSPLVNPAKSFPEIFWTFQIAFLRKEKNGYWNSGCKNMWCRSWLKKQQIVLLIARETAFG